jgi:hypothetical protein
MTDLIYLAAQNKILHDTLLQLRDPEHRPNTPEGISLLKFKIRDQLRSYRSAVPNIGHNSFTLNHAYPNLKNVVFYSFLHNAENPSINEHEYKRLKISWKSLRVHNKDIEVRFCLGGQKLTTKDKSIWQNLCDDYGITLYGFHKDFQETLPNAWCIHRWYNLALWEKENLNILYMDADTYVNGDIGQVFDLYSRDPIYGREELGFRHDPNSGVSGEDPRFFLDLVDASILAQGGIVEVQKYCLGVILLNGNTHKLFTHSLLSEYTSLLQGIHTRELFYSIPNYRIMDEFAFWIILSRLGIRTSLFGDQDVSHTFLEKKHETHFNPIVLHYTTKDEEKFADWSPEFSGLSRTEEQRGESDLGAGYMINVNPMMWDELSMSMW